MECYRKAFERRFYVAQPKNESLDELGQNVLKELEILRKFAILDFLDRGYSQAQIADVLGVNQSTISRMFPKGIPKKEK